MYKTKMPHYSKMSPAARALPADSLLANRAMAYRVFIEGAREILGAEKLAFFTADFRPNGRQAPAAAAALLSHLEETYGAVGGGGLTQRIGRAMFRYGLKDIGEQVGFRDMGFRILPSPRRVENALRILACFLTDIIGEPVQIFDQGTAWTVQMACCPPPGSPAASHLYGNLATGLIQELTSWAGGGRYFSVAETACRAAGATACVFQVDKKPLD